MAPLCSRCLRTLSHRASSRRLLSTTSPYRASVLTSSGTALREPPSGSHEGPPAATSTAAAQPFSTPLTPAPEPGEVRQQDASAQPKKVTGSVREGTNLKGLAWLKGKNAPIAMADHEYPDWLWTLLDDAPGAKQKEQAGSGVSEYGGTRKQRQRARKEATRSARLNPEASVPKTPLEEQSVDLPSGDGSVQGSVEALGARQELTDALRKKRRKDIKEANFLKGMR